MKKNYTLISIVSMFLFVVTVNAQVTLSQTTTNTITPGTVSCNTGATGTPPFVTADNIYYRAWDLSALGYTQFDVTEVEFGVESVANESAGFAIDVIIYSNTGGSFPAGTLTPVTTVSVPLVTADTGTLITVPISATVMAPAELVVGFSIPDDSAGANTTSCFLGSNADGQSAPTYISSVSCGLASPTDMAGIGFPDVHLIANVTGNATLSLNDVELTKISISPNPTTDVLNVNVHNSNAIKTLNLYNLTGQLVKKVHNQSQINISNLNAGVYMLQVETENGAAMHKIIKQ